MDQGKKPTRMKRIGDLLQEKGITSPDALEKFLRERYEAGIVISEILQEMELIMEYQILNALSRQLHVPFIDLDGEQPVDMHVVRLMSAELVKSNKALPWRLEGDTLVVAMVDPSNQKVISNIALITGYSIKPGICSEKALEEVYQKLFSEKE